MFSLYSSIRTILSRSWRCICTAAACRYKELALYLHRCRLQLGHPPARTEVIGGELLELRFGTWANALLKIGVEDGYAIQKQTPALEQTQLFREEYEAQRKLDRKKKVERKAQNRKRMQK